LDELALPATIGPRHVRLVFRHATLVNLAFADKYPSEPLPPPSPRHIPPQTALPPRAAPRESRIGKVRRASSLARRTGYRGKRPGFSFGAGASRRRFRRVALPAPLTHRPQGMTGPARRAAARSPKTTRTGGSASSADRAFRRIATTGGILTRHSMKTVHAGPWDRAVRGSAATRRRYASAHRSPAVPTPPARARRTRLA
jgi:hypothetical protein